MRMASGEAATRIGLLEELSGPIHPIEMDPGIQRLVGLLNSKGLPTRLSCAGHYDRVGPRGWNGYVVLDAHGFRAYLANNAAKLEQLLLSNILVTLDIAYQGSPLRDGSGWVVSHDTGIYEPTQITVSPTLVVAAPPLGWCGGDAVALDAEKSAWLASVEADVQKYL